MEPHNCGVSRRFKNFFNHSIIALFTSSFNHEMWDGNVLRWRTSTGWSRENCLEESPFKTWWKVVDDWSSFVKFPNEIKTYILNKRMVVHDWERKEYKILLNFFSVVKYKLCIYNVLWFADLIQNHQVYIYIYIYK